MRRNLRLTGMWNGVPVCCIKAGGQLPEEAPNMMIHKDDQKCYFFCGHSQSAGRQGDLYVLRKRNCWHINAGVDSYGHNPGFGVCCDVMDGSEEMVDYEQFLQKACGIQEFMIAEFRADAETCRKVFLEIWQYIHQTGR